MKPPVQLRKLWSLVPHRQRRTARVLLAQTVIGTGLEALGVALVVPAISLLTNQDLSAIPALSRWIGLMGYQSVAEAVVLVMAALVAVYGLKAVYLGYLAWQQARFSFDLLADVSQRLFAGYLHQPWTFHLQRNSAQLLRNVTTETNILNNVVQALISMITDGFVLIALGVLLISAEPLGTSVVIVALGSAAWVFQRVTHRRLIEWGRYRQQADGYRIQHVQEGLGGLKDVKMLGREAEFLNQYEIHNRTYARVARRMATLQQIPRLWLEFLAILGLGILVTIMLWQGREVAALLPTLGLFGAATFRLMPSIIRIMNSFQAFRYYQPVLDTVHDELAAFQTPAHVGAAPPLPPLSDAIELAGVTFRYPNAHRPAVADVTLSIPRGTAVGVVGGSGAGKSTLVDVMLGLLTPTTGAVTVDGIDIQRNLPSWQRQIGYVPQSIFLTDDTLRRNVAFGLAEDQIDDAAVSRALAAAQLDEFVQSLPAGVQTTVGERGVQLSGGQRQRIGIARALYHDPPVLVLDEATSSLDAATEQGVMAAVRRLQGIKTLIIVAHRLSTVAACDKLFKLESGRIVAEGSFDHVTQPTHRGHP
ncbi:MAG TPA: ABC transporter ATP-binding protein [Vicinamibacterales bacterium]|nr:ABC transporter ATP-binding protein [Vicinamibacterales bacterium]